MGQRQKQPKITLAKPTPPVIECPLFLGNPTSKDSYLSLFEDVGVLLIRALFLDHIFGVSLTSFLIDQILGETNGDHRGTVCFPLFPYVPLAVSVCDVPGARGLPPLGLRAASRGPPAVDNTSGH